VSYPSASVFWSIRIPREKKTMSLRTVNSGNTRHPLYPLYLGIFGILCVIGGVIFAAEFRPSSSAHAEEAPLNAQAAVMTPSQFSDNPFRAVVKKVKPAVVNIETERPIGSGQQGNPFNGMPFQFGPPQPQTSPFGDEQQTTPTGGSGFIVDPAGYVITNNHVVEDAVRITVALDDGRILDAEVIGTDPNTDVAVIKLKDAGNDLPYLSLGDSDHAEIGDWVIAVGSPLGLSQSVTVGVVSAKNRNQVNIPGAGGRYSDFIQTDAAINFGNSGGPLLTIDGMVLGMNTAIAGGNGVSGIGFAVPANKIKFVYDNLIRDGVVRRGYIGLYVEPVSLNEARANGLTIPKGATVQQVEANTPAGRAGIEFGDLITHVDGIEVQNNQHLVNLIAEKGVGITVNVRLLRDAKPLELKIKTEQRPDELDAAKGPRTEEAAPDEEVAPEGETLILQGLGLQLSDIDSALNQRLDLPAGTVGIYVDAVKKNSSAWDEGIAEGDVITHIDRTPITSTADFQQIFDRAGADDGYARLSVKRLIRGEWVSFPFTLPVN